MTEPDPVKKEKKELELESPDGGAEWMLAFQAGDESAFDRIVSRYQTSVFQFILRTVGDRGRAEDLTQDLFIRVYRSRARYEPKARFQTWLFTIASRLGLNEIRAQRRRRRLFVSPAAARGDHEQDGSGGEPLGAVPQRQDATPSERLECQELSQIVETMLAELPPNQRAALQLQMSEDFSYREIAEVLGVSTLAVKSLLVRAREALKQGVDSYLRGEKHLRGKTS